MRNSLSITYRLQDWTDKDILRNSTTYYLRNKVITNFLMVPLFLFLRSCTADRLLILHLIISLLYILYFFERRLAFVFTYVLFMYADVF